MRPIEAVRRLCPKARPNYLAGFENGDALFKKHGITTPLRLAHFLAQCLHETGGLRIEWESGAYSAERLVEIFGVGRHSAGITRAEAAQLAGDGPAIFERVYGLGNPKKARELGNTQPGDGYRYRGGGIMQTTGRANYRRMGQKCGVDFEGRPELVVAPAHALKPALAEWSEGNLNAAADRNDILTITKRINGGTNGLADRRSWLAKATALIDRVDLGHAEPDPDPPREPSAADDPVVPLPAPRPDDRTDGDAHALPWWHPKRIWIWVTGGPGVGALAWLTDPWAWAKLIALLAGVALIAALIALAVALLLYGRAATGSWIKRHILRQVE